MRPFVVCAALAATLASPAAVHAQDAADACWLARGTPADAAARPSPLDSAVVILGGERAKVCYGAPSARGRAVMGGLVPWGEPWRLGANEATTLHLPFEAELGSVRLAPGVYSLYAVPGPERWTVVVNGSVHRWGIPISPEVRAADLGGFEVAPEATDAPVDRLTLRFEPRGDAAADLLVSWEETLLVLPLRRVEP